MIRSSDADLEGIFKTATCFRGYARVGADAGGVGIAKDAVVECISEVVYIRIV
jgi:hypothetical protein